MLCKKLYLVCILFVLIVVAFLNDHFRIYSINFVRPSKGDISVLCYNVHSLGSNFEKDAPDIAKLITESNTDFIYLTEYYEANGDTIDAMLSKHYPHTFTKHRWGMNEGDVFYSKWHIDSVARFCVNGKRIMAYRVQVSCRTDTIALYCCHLASNNVNSQITTRASIKNGYHNRILETKEILKHIKADKYPSIIMGDMNDVSGSHTLNSFENAGFEDAWWKGGMGYGSTFHSRRLNLRIDHILYDKHFRLTGVRVLRADYSDHDALFASFNWKR